MSTERQTRLALNATMAPGSRAGQTYRRSVARFAAAPALAAAEVAPVVTAAVAGGHPPTPEHDLLFHGGRTLADLTFANFYVGGEAAWDASDKDNIDQALAAAMSDEDLNNVLVQYFSGGPITSSFSSSAFLPGPPPATVSRGDIDALVEQAQAAGWFDGADLTQTVFNFLLPRGTTLTDDEAPSGAASDADAEAGSAAPAAADESPLVAEEESDSRLDGLAGYHGSVQLDLGKVYFAVSVFSEQLPDGTTNGIPGFPAEPWKSVVATLYHELCEARTDPDVEEANRTGNASLLGWVSAHGEEIGDFALGPPFALNEVIQDVALADGSGTVPVQFEYSNFVHGPEGPADEARPAAQ